MGTSADEAAREATSTPAVRVAARLGYVANGLLHLILGGIIVSVAFGANADSDQSGAFKAIAAAPLGFVALWALAAGLWALGAWYVLDGFLQRDRPGTKGKAKKWGRRVSLWARAAVYIALGGIAASVALGSRPNGDQSTEQASQGVLSLPGGPFILGAAGVAVGAIGVGFVVIGVRRGFRKKVDLPPGAPGKTVVAVGVVGYIAKGVSLATVGILVLVAAVQVDPDAAGGLDAAIQTLVGLPFGPVIVAAVGFGFLAYGVFCVVRARYARLDT
ncbi:DUF1206 domain-containing protein [Microbacterium xanthum]|uniref:DUF1206 domain-containing protein n=1 Tax=Microbacterium xanthum TaxID=3079794 RepID=UPI002AD44763|nr:DUF1206 domain-containing protein [Microbacterium sp. KSW-48]MDZ8171262.1 DUF1206 domain-containing protein [Microbacterium sp. KSW-48]